MTNVQVRIPSQIPTLSATIPDKLKPGSLQAKNVRGEPTQPTL